MRPQAWGYTNDCTPAQQVGALQGLGRGCADRARAGAAALRRRARRTGVGAHPQLRDDLHHACAGAQYRRRLRGPARPGLHRVLRGRRVHVCAARVAALQHPSAVLGVPFSGPQKYYYVLLLLTIGVIVINIRLQNSRLGRAWEAIREDEVAAKAMGINTRNVKLLAFAMGASFGGIAGGIFSATQEFVSPESFGLFESIIVLAMVVLGGMGNIPGVILGAILLTLLPEVLRSTMEPLQNALFGRVLLDAETVRLLVFGIALVAIMLYRPAGLWPSAVRKRELEVPKVVAE